MAHIHERCFMTAEEYGAPGNYVVGANMAAFQRVADAHGRARVDLIGPVDVAVAPDRTSHADVDDVRPTLLTVGHGTLSADALTALLREAAVAAVVDVRRFPGSRRHPQFGRDEFERWLPAAGIAYRWEQRLCGRRRGRGASRHVALRNDSFRAYADRMESEEWQVAMRAVVQEAPRRRVALMCSESVWWRCHRRFIADAATLLHDCAVGHLMHDGSRHEHRPTIGVWVDAGELVYDRRDATSSRSPRLW